MLTHKDIRGIQKKTYHTSNTYAGAHHYPTPHQHNMGYNQNPTAYQSPQVIRQTLTRESPPN